MSATRATLPAGPLLALLAVAVGARPGPGQERNPADRLLVCNRANGTVSLFAAADGRELATVAAGRDPRAIVVADDARIAVVADGAGALVVLDTDRGERRREIALRHEGRTLHPFDVAFCGSRQVVVACGPGAPLLRVEIDIDAAAQSNAVTPLTIELPAERVAVLGSKVAVASADGRFAVFGLANLQGAAPAAQSASDRVHDLLLRPGRPESGECWLVHGETDAVAIRDDRGWTRLDTGAVPRRLAFTPDGARALVPCLESGELLVFDAHTRRVEHAVSLHGDRSEQGYRPHDVAVDADGRFAYVTCSRGEQVAVVAIALGEVVDRIDTGPGPDAIVCARRSPRDAPIRR